MSLDEYGKKNAALSSLETVSVGEAVAIDSKKFGGIVSLRNAINYFTRRHPGFRFTTKSCFPDVDTVYVKRIS